MKKFILPFLLMFLVSLPGMSQFATSKYRYARNDVQFAKQTLDLTAPQVAMSQGTLKLGVTVGFLLSRLRQEGFEDSKDRAAFQFGGHLQYFITDQLVVMAGLIVALHGTRFQDSDDYGYNITSLLIPIMLGYYVIPQLMIMAGIQPGFILSFKDTDDDDLKEFFNGFDFGIKLGALYDFNEQFSARVAYTFGLADYLEDNETDAVTSRMLEISLIYWLWSR